MKDPRQLELFTFPNEQDTQQSEEKLKFGNYTFSRGSSGYEKQEQWLVNLMIPKTSFGVLFGPSGSLKSYIAIDMCCAIATTQKSWLGKSTETSAVVYIAAEGQAGIAKRVKGWELENNQTVRDLYVLGESISLSEQLTAAQLIYALQQIEERQGVKIGLIVIDTLARCFEGDENSSRDMSSFVRNCDYLRNNFDATLLCIHHSGRDEARGARGSTALRAACDFEFRVKRIGTSTKVSLQNTKQKEACEADPIDIEFSQIDIGTRCEDSLPVNTLVRSNYSSSSATPSTPNCSILIALRASKDKKLTREELRNTVFAGERKLTDAMRKSLSRKLDKYNSEGLIQVMKAGIKASDSDLIILL